MDYKKRLKKMSRVAKKFAVVDRFGTIDKEISRLSRKSDDKLRKALKPVVELWIDEPIRKVVAYEDRVNYGGYCNTCAFEEQNFDIYFKSNEGVLCKYTFDGSFADLMLFLSGSVGGL